MWSKCQVKTLDTYPSHDVIVKTIWEAEQFESHHMHGVYELWERRFIARRTQSCVQGGILETRVVSTSACQIWRQNMYNTVENDFVKHIAGVDYSSV